MLSWPLACRLRPAPCAAQPARHRAQLAGQRSALSGLRLRPCTVAALRTVDFVYSTVRRVAKRAIRLLDN